MSPKDFEARLRTVFEDRGLSLRRELHPSDRTAIKRNRPLRYGEKRFTWQVFRKSKTGKEQMVWNITRPSGKPAELHEREIAWMARCDNYRHWKNNCDAPTQWDLDRMDQTLFNMDGEEEERRKQMDRWREYRREHCMPAFRHDLIRMDRSLRNASTTQHAARNPQVNPRRKGKLIYAGG